MKSVTKKLSLITLLVCMFACLIFGVSSMNFTKSYAETPTSGIIADFTSDDTVKLGSADGMPLTVAKYGVERLYNAQASYITNVDTDSDGVIDAENAFKALYGGYTSAWVTFGMKFNNPVKLSDVANVKIRYYAHVTKNTLVFFAGANDNYVTRVNSTDWVSVKKNTWVTENISSDKLSYLADANGDISSIGVAVGNNGGGYFDTDAYVLFDSVSYTINVTIDNDTANTGIENVTYETEVGKITKPDTDFGFGYVAEYYSDEERTIPFDFDSVISKNATIYAKKVPLTVAENVITEFSEDDSRYNTSTVKPSGGVNLIASTKYSYVTDVDTDGDGVIDAKDAVKITGFGSQWAYFGVEFASSVSIDDVAAVTIRYYANFTNDVALRVFGESDGYKLDMNYGTNDYKRVVNGKWYEQTLRSDRYQYLANSEGKIKNITFSFGFFTAYNSDAYFLLDSITFTPVVKNTVDFMVGEDVFASERVKAGATVVMPNAPDTAEKAFVGWVNGANIYKAGTEIIVESDCEYTAFYLAFKTEDKASARTAEPYGLRFISLIDETELNELTAFNGVTYTFGTIITSNGSTKSVDIVGNSELMYSADGNVCFNAALVNIKENNAVRVYHAKGYLTITYSDGETLTVNAIKETSEGRSYMQVLDAVIGDETADETLRETAQTIFDSVKENSAVKPSISISVDGEKVENSTFSSVLSEYFAGKSWKVDDTVNIADISFNGYTIDVANSTLSGTVGLRGLTLTIALVTEA